MARWGENLGLIHGHTLPSSQHPCLWCEKNPDKESLVPRSVRKRFLLGPCLFPALRFNGSMRGWGSIGWGKDGVGGIKAKQSSQRDRPHLGELQSRWRQCPQAEWRAPGQTKHWPAYCQHMPAAPAASLPLGGPGVWSQGALAGGQLRIPPPLG